MEVIEPIIDKDDSTVPLTFYGDIKSIDQLTAKDVETVL